MLRAVLAIGLGLALIATAAAIAAASTGGLPNIGQAKMTAEPVYRGFYDHHVDPYVIAYVSLETQAKEHGKLTMKGC
jgi:hypothetical protein